MCDSGHRRCSNSDEGGVNILTQSLSHSILVTSPNGGIWYISPRLSVRSITEIIRCAAVAVVFLGAYSTPECWMQPCTVAGSASTDRHHHLSHPTSHYPIIYKDCLVMLGGG